MGGIPGMGINRRGMVHTDRQDGCRDTTHRHSIVHLGGQLPQKDIFSKLYHFFLNEFNRQTIRFALSIMNRNPNFKLVNRLIRRKERTFLNLLCLKPIVNTSIIRFIHTKS